MWTSSRLLLISEAASVPVHARKLQLVLLPAQYRFEWFRPETAKVEKTGDIQTAGGDQKFKAPFPGAAVL
jgi:hypothetical protein